MIVRKLAAEFIGTAMIVAAVVGSGIAATQLSPTDVGLQLLENAIATAAVLVAMIAALGAVSGAQFNPVVSLADRMLGGLSTRETVGYVIAQVSGGIIGAFVANAMFAHPVFEFATKTRSSGPLWFAEVFATFGLVMVIFGLVRSGRSAIVPFAVGCYIAGTYFFTASTSFANPAVTIARMFSDSFAGIAPASVPAFVVAQLLGGALGLAATRLLYPNVSDVAADAVMPHPLNSEQEIQ